MYLVAQGKAQAVFQYIFPWTSLSLMPCLQAAWFGQASLVEQLLQAGACPRSLDANRLTPLHAAVLSGLAFDKVQPVVQLLAKACPALVDPCWSPPQGNMPLATPQENPGSNPSRTKKVMAAAQRKGGAPVSPAVDDNQEAGVDESNADLARAQEVREARNVRALLVLDFEEGRAVLSGGVVGVGAAGKTRSLRSCIGKQNKKLRDLVDKVCFLLLFVNAASLRCTSAHHSM